MKRRRGGKSPLLSFKPLVGLLVCANIVVLGLVVRETVKPAFSADTQQIGSCADTPPKLEGLALSLDHPGLTQEEAAPWYYQVSGRTPDEINESIRQCSPVRDAGSNNAYTADTSYLLNWRADYRRLASGKCVVDRVAVGIRTRHIYPLWQKETQTPESTTTAWDSFMDNLATHEQGHVRTNVQYATELVHDLGAMPSYDCDTIENQAKVVAKARTAALAAANQAYDDSTGHGRTQGALLFNP